MYRFVTKQNIYNLKWVLFDYVTSIRLWDIYSLNAENKLITLYHEPRLFLKKKKNVEGWDKEQNGQCFKSN